MRTLLTLACLGLAIQPLAAQNPQNPLTAQTSAESGVLGTPAAVEANYSVTKAVPEDARRVRLNIHFDNKSTAIRPGTVRVIVRDPQGVACHESSAPFELKPGDGNIFSTDACCKAIGIIRSTIHLRAGTVNPQRAVLCGGPTGQLFLCVHDSASHDGRVARQQQTKRWLDAEDGKLTVSWTYDNLDSTLMIRCVRSKRTAYRDRAAVERPAVRSQHLDAGDGLAAGAGKPL